MTDPTPMACAVCGYIVTRMQSPTGRVAWLHGGGSPDDHPVVAVPWTYIHANVRCDFCNLVADPTWTLPSEDYEIAPGHMNTGSWAVCVTCLPYLQSGDWDGLIDRQLEVRIGTPEQGVPREVFEWMYGLLKEHITGEPYPEIMAGK